jgi:hypothetical protein
VDWVRRRHSEHLGGVDDLTHRINSINRTAAAILGQSSICTRATRRYSPPSGLKMDASPSLTSNQSFPSASMIFGLCVMRMSFFPLSGALANAQRFRPPIVLVRRHHEATFGQMYCRLDIFEAGQHAVS